MLKLTNYEWFIGWLYLPLDVPTIAGSPVSLVASVWMSTVNGWVQSAINVIFGFNFIYRNIGQLIPQTDWAAILFPWSNPKIPPQSLEFRIAFVPVLQASATPNRNRKSKWSDLSLIKYHTGNANKVLGTICIESWRKICHGSIIQINRPRAVISTGSKFNTTVPHFRSNANGIPKIKSSNRWITEKIHENCCYCWLAKCCWLAAAVCWKLKVVSLPVKPVKYWKQFAGGLEESKIVYIAFRLGFMLRSTWQGLYIPPGSVSIPTSLSSMFQ